MNVSAPTVSQRAAVAALGPEAKLELQAHVRKYQANQQVVVAGLAAMGVQAHEYAPPQGAFYMYVNFTAHGVTGATARVRARGAKPEPNPSPSPSPSPCTAPDSLGLCGALLEEAGVAMTPGVDFEEEGSGLGQLAPALTRTLNPHPHPHPHPSPSPSPTTNHYPYPYPGERRVRISFPGSTEHVAEAMRRLQRWWQSEQGRRWHS